MSPDNAKKTARQDPDSRRAVLIAPNMPMPRPPAPPAVPRPPAAVRPVGLPPIRPPLPRPIGKLPPAWGRRESFWKTLAVWSVLVFALILGLTALGWTYWNEGGRFGSSWSLRHGRQGQPAVQAPPAPVPSAKRRAIDGRPVAADAASVGYYAVMVENMIDARPLSGLAKAPLVIEAPVEGGITRFLAVFPAEDVVDRIGPVRSARPYYLDWAQEFDALYAHVGGSPEALNKLSELKIKDLNQFSWGKYFWRDSGRKAPHNVYTSTSLLADAASARFSDRRTRETAGWTFKDDAASSERPQSSPDIVIDYSTPAYRVTWSYDRQNNYYVRSEGAKEQLDEDNSPIRAKNIVVQYNKVAVLDDIGRRRIETVGEGPALVAVDGLTRDAVWKKASAQARTRYYDAKGQEIEFNAGSTWVEVVPSGMEVAH